MSEAKADAGKLEIDLVPPQIIRDISEVRMYGNQKYHDPNNWKTVELRRYVNALLRHTLAFMEDINSVDEESGIKHYKHMACNMSFICEMMKEEQEKNEFAKGGTGGSGYTEIVKRNVVGVGCGISGAVNTLDF